MTTSDGLIPVKGELLRFLLTDDYGVGEAQCKRERVIQCANIPRHEQKRASDALDEMIRSTDVPVYSKGGGGRDVVQLNPSQLERAQELCNEWHPERSVGDTFDPTDLSDGSTKEQEAFSVPYDHKGTVWNCLEETDVDFDHEHGATVEGVDADRLVFVVTGRQSPIEQVVADVVDETRGEVERCETADQAVAIH